MHRIAEKLRAEYTTQIGHRPAPSEMASWQNSLMALSMLLDQAEPVDQDPRERRMPERTERQQATVRMMIDIAEQMAAQTQLIARRDVVEVGDVDLTDDEEARLAEALRHIETAATDLQRLRGVDRP